MATKNLAPTADAAPPKARARVLVACQFGQPDDVVELSSEDMHNAVAAGLVDHHPDAVAYAESLASQE